MMIVTKIIVIFMPSVGTKLCEMFTDDQEHECPALLCNKHGIMSHCHASNGSFITVFMTHISRIWVSLPLMINDQYIFIFIWICYHSSVVPPVIVYVFVWVITEETPSPMSINPGVEPSGGINQKRKVRFHYETIEYRFLSKNYFHIFGTGQFPCIFLLQSSTYQCINSSLSSLWRNVDTQRDDKVPAV